MKDAQKKMLAVFAEQDDSVDEISEQEVLDTAALLRQYLTRDDDPRRAALLDALDQGAPLTGENGVRRKLAAFDLEYWGWSYFPH